MPITVDTFLYGVAGFLCLYWCFHLFIHLSAIIYGRLKFRHKSSEVGSDALPGVSILKPLTGVDPNLHGNLESFFTLKYPKFELLFSVENDSDTAIPVVQCLLEKYPSVDATLFVGAKAVGMNPKVNNMIQGYGAAKYGLIMISDSGMRMKEDTLLDMASYMTERVGLVHQMPYAWDRDGFGSRLEKVYFGTQHGKIYLGADMFGVNCMTGMSCLFRKHVLDEAGGLANLGQYLAEDFYLGQAFHQRGWKMRVSSQPAWQNSGNVTTESFQARMRRWAKLRLVLVPFMAVMEPTFECMLHGLLIAWACTVMFAWSGLVCFLLHVLLWFLLDYLLLTTVQVTPLPFSKYDFMVTWLFRECTSLYNLICAHMEPMITWRSRKFVIRHGAVGEEVQAVSCV